MGFNKTEQDAWTNVSDQPIIQNEDEFPTTDVRMIIIWKV